MSRYLEGALGKPREPEPIRDPRALTPIQYLGSVDGGPLFIKREDAFAVNGAHGAKARAVLEIALAREAKGLTTAGNRWSPMISRVARVAQELGIPSRCWTASSKEPSPEERDAELHGATVVKPGVNYLSALVSKARRDAEDHGWLFIPPGVAFEEYVPAHRLQVENVPDAAARIVLPVGTGMALASILWGLLDNEAAGREGIRRHRPLGIVVGMAPEPALDQFGPPDWRSMCDLQRAESDFREASPNARWWGVDLDPHYEAKAAPFAQIGDLFWIVARSSVLA